MFSIGRKVGALRAVAIIGLTLVACGGTAAVGPLVPLADPQLAVLVTPSPEGHQPFVKAIDDARASVDMMMFHLSDEEVVAALVRAAKRGVRVRVILDRNGLRSQGGRHVDGELRAGGVDVRASSAGFSISHAKEMVIDDSTAFVTAINLTGHAATTRDLGIVTRDRGVIADLDELFASDWASSRTNSRRTPPRHSPSLVVSPVDARGKLVALVATAKREVLVTVENLGDPDITRAFVDATKRGVAVRVIVPLCDKNPNPLYNLPAAREVARGGAGVRVMPPPESAEHPYMHSKMILVDGATAYVGSVNFSINSMSKAREIGIVVANEPAATLIHDVFEADWGRSVEIPASTAGACGR